MTMPKKKCSVEGCTRVVIYPQIGLCGACYAGLHYWMKKRSVRKVIARSQQIAVWQERMQMLLGDKKLAILRPKKKRRAA